MKIRIEQLKFQYPRGAFELDVPELEIDAASHVAVIGPSGSGKTTLLRLLAGIYLPHKGTLTLDEVPVSQLNDAQRREFRIRHVGFVFQDFQLIDYLDVQENIRLPYRIHRALRWDDKAAKRLRMLTQATAIEDKQTRRVEELSLGEQQRVAICRALMTGPRLLLADEPTGNLDPASKQNVLEILREQAHQHKATLIVVTHDQALLDQFERVIDFHTFHSSVVQ